MNRLLLLFTLIIYASKADGQTVLFEENFENVGATWTSYGDPTPNFWISNTCAGNGPTIAGQNARYISFAGFSPGCGPGGIINYGYQNADNGGTKSTITATQVNATCAGGLQISYDHLLNVDNVNDFAELVYSTDNGGNWTIVGGHITPGATWQPTTTALPAVLDFSTFLLGFKFTYNDNVIGANPLAIDNVKVSGVDVQNPTITCPANQSVNMSASCQGTLGDYTSLATATDNCSSGSNLIFTQNPIAGTIISTNTAVQITVADQSGNTVSCSFTALAIDTLKPVIACLESMIIDINNNCQFLVPDLTTTVTVTDNCTTAGNFTITQNPLAGTTATGVTDVSLTVTDQAGNSSLCNTRIFTNDTIAPTIACPPNVNISNGTSCDYVIGSYIATAVVVESCPYFNVYQNPPAGATIGTGQQAVVLTVIDVMSNQSSCTFYVNVIETVAPIITNCPVSVATCNPVVVFSDVTATDNCVNVAIIQTDLSGLSSGDTFPVGVTPMQFTVSDSSGNTAVCNFSVEVYASPSIANIALDSIALCENTVSNIAADPITSGMGVWSQVTGTGNIGSPTSASTGVTNLGNGLNTFVWTVSTPQCGTNRDTVNVTVYQQGTTATVQTDTLYACSAFSSLLLGSFPTVGEAKWTTNQGGVIVSPNQHNTVANSLSQGWNDFIYTISSGSCPSSSDTLSIYYNNSAGIVSADTTICKDLTNFQVFGAAPAVGQTSAWYFIQGQGQILTPNDSSSFIQNMPVGLNKVVYRLSHPVCGFSYDTLAITVNTCGNDDFVFPTVITPNFDGKNDLFIVENLNALHPTCDVTIVNRWGSVVYESKGYQTPWNGTFKNEDLPMGTYFYRINLNDSGKTSFSGPISIIR